MCRGPSRAPAPAAAYPCSPRGQSFIREMKIVLQGPLVQICSHVLQATITLWPPQALKLQLFPLPASQVSSKPSGSKAFASGKCARRHHPRGRGSPRRPPSLVLCEFEKNFCFQRRQWIYECSMLQSVYRLCCVYFFRSTLTLPSILED